MEDLNQYDETELLTMGIFGEAEGEGVVGQLAVGLVMRNRFLDPKKRFGATFKEVLLRPKQFSCFNSNSERLPKMIALLKTHIPENPYLQISWIAYGIHNTLVADDITKGATHYLTKELYGDPKKCPAWAKKGVVTNRIGQHVFLKA